MKLFDFQVLGVITSLIAPVLGWPVIWWPKWRNFDERRNYKTISSIYNLTVYPNQVPIIQSGAAGVPSGLFSQNVVGRVDPVGNFTGFQDSIEYFFALAPLPQGNAASAAITSYKITEFTSGCQDVAASVVYLYCSVVKPGCPDDGKALGPLKQVTRYWRKLPMEFCLIYLGCILEI